MTEPLRLDKAHSALLVMDYQKEILGSLLHLDFNAGLLERATATLEAARRASLPVIYVVARFRPGYPEIGTLQPLQRLRNAGMLQEGTPGAEIHEAVVPQPGEVVITKRRVGAFSTTDLAAILRAGGITNLILMGVVTSGVVLSTVRWAADTDYTLTVIEDCCADRDEEVHQVLTRKVFPNQAQVIKAGDFIAALAD